MSRYVLAVLLVLVMLAVPVSAGFSYNFQNPTEFGGLGCGTGTGGTCSYIESATGGNSYVETTATQCTAYSEIYNSVPDSTTYAAATIVSTTNIASNARYIRIRFYNSTHVLSVHTSNAAITSPARYQVIIDGGIAKVYKNGVLMVSTGYLGANPTAIAWGVYVPGDCPAATTVRWDDIVYGSSTPTTIFGNPRSDYYVIKKDLLNPASSGLAIASTGVVINSNNFTTTYGRGNLTAGGYIPEKTLSLMSFTDGSIRDTRELSAGSYAGSVSWALDKAFFNEDLPAGVAPNGFYTTYVQGESYYPNIISYESMGANVAWNSETYRTDDSATITYTVTDTPGSDYWDTALYDYTLKVQDVYGTVYKSWSLTSASDIKSLTFDDTYTTGEIYFATLWATRKSDSRAYLLGSDDAELFGTVGMQGYVLNGETCFPITNANVSITQGSLVSNSVTILDGNYSTSAALSFITGSAVQLNVTNGSYRQYLFGFTPQASKTLNINFTLVPLAPTTSGIGIGGVVSDSAYQRPIGGATVTATNATYGESYSVTANSCGYYLIDTAHGGYLTNGRCYQLTATRPGYTHKYPLGVVCAEGS